MLGAIDARREESMDRNLALRLYAILVLALASSGCELVGGIFKAGMWVGVLMVLGIIALVFFAVAKMKS
jgi:hypothetical protein